ncbi:MAG: M28 family peptidase [Candidatus Latescibacteria bacterium]|nr:M28 family peptidase [Candidatus Latescibacterota bacterium]
MSDNTRHLVESPERRATYFARMLKTLCTDLGPHPSGSKEYEQATQIIHAEMARAVPTVYRDRYLDFWAVVPRPEINHRARRLTVGVAENCGGTSDAGFKGIIKRLDVEGVPYGIVDEATGQIAAHISVSSDVGVEPQYLVGDDVLGLPRFIIGIIDVPYVELLVENREPVLVRLRVVHAPEVPTYNIIGTIPGQSREEILCMAHADSIVLSEGANDNTATAIITLMLANAFSGSQGRNTLTFLITGSEEYGCMGAQHYVKRRQAEGTARHLKFIINSDSLTYGPNLWPTTTDPELMQVVRSIHADLNLSTQPIYDEAECWMNDAAPFRGINPHIRGINFNSRGYDTLAANHTADDNAANVPHDCAESSFLVLRELIGRMQDL